MQRTVCAGCGSGDLTDFLDLGSSPLADRFPASVNDQETWYPLVVAVCGACWLVQLREVVPDSKLYSDDYGFRTGSSPSSVTYFRDMAVSLLDRYEDQARRLTVEIACNDGTLLQHFGAIGCRTLGVEPARGAAEETARRGMPVLMYPFSQELAEKIKAERGEAGLVIACNVAAHVADPADFLAGIADLLADDGLAVIEFQNLEALIAGCQFDHVYHEHRFFYSLRTFAALAQQAGLAVMDWTRTPAQGGSLRMTLTRQHNPVPVSGWPKGWLEDMTQYTGMQDRALYMKWRLLELLSAERDQGRIVAGYAASAKSATLLNFCQIGPVQVPWIEDITPGKIGRYAPGSHIPIRSPNEQPRADTYLLTAWNYLSGILHREQKFLATGGRFIVPGPVPVMI